jgi:hypothetical protein
MLQARALAGWSTRTLLGNLDQNCWDTEVCNGCNQTRRQLVWGTQYVDELIFMDVNGDPTESNDCDPDDQSGESTYDRRYFCHQGANWNVLAWSEYDDAGVGTDGRFVERYAYTPYGEFIVLKGDPDGGGEHGQVLGSSQIGNTSNAISQCRSPSGGHHPWRALLLPSPWHSGVEAIPKLWHWFVTNRDHWLVGAATQVPRLVPDAAWRLSSCGTATVSSAAAREAPRWPALPANRRR